MGEAKRKKINLVVVYFFGSNLFPSHLSFMKKKKTTTLNCHSSIFVFQFPPLSIVVCNSGASPFDPVRIRKTHVTLLKEVGWIGGL
jgi:hypothetical protein